MHEAWLVDLDGTLYRPLPVKLAMGFQVLLGGRRVARCIQAFRREHEHLRQSQSEPVSDPYRLQLERAAERLGIKTERLDDVIREWMRERPGPWIRRFARRELLAEIGAFHENGGKTALVSDYPATEKLQALDAVSLFDVVIANGEPNGPPRLKPWPDGYLRAAEQLGVAPDRCLVLGDRDDADGEAARRGGMEFRRIG